MWVQLLRYKYRQNQKLKEKDKNTERWMKEWIENIRFNDERKKNWRILIHIQTQIDWQKKKKEQKEWTFGWTRKQNFKNCCQLTTVLLVSRSVLVFNLTMFFSKVQFFAKIHFSLKLWSCKLVNVNQWAFC
jgi:hypothetical protein